MALSAALRARPAPTTATPRRMSADCAVRGFDSAEEAWFWTISALIGRRQGARSDRGSCLPRPCEPDDVVKCLDQLYRHRRIDLVHARILRKWGERGMAPNATYPAERTDAKLWREAMERLEWPLRIKGIVG